MGVPFSQMWTVATYVLKNELLGRKRYPLVLMLEPLFRCNLACAGCGKIQYPPEILRRQLTPEECFRAVDECGAPIVSIPGGEPLLHPQIDQIVAGLVARRKYVYLCTNALLLEKHLHRFQPSKYLSFSVHLDGPQAEHDRAVCREGVYEVAVRAIRTAIRAGFRVTTNSTFFNTADPETCRRFFDELMELGVEGMMISPGYPYEKAPDQEHFLHRQETMALFRRILGGRRHRWRFNQSPLFLEFLKGNFDLECTPWGNPTYNIFGWQRPCYLLDEGYCATFRELLETTDWSAYGHRSGNPKCADCMVHSGYEPSAVRATFRSLRGLLATLRVMIFGSLPMRPLSAPDVAAGPSSVLSRHAAGELVPLQNFIEQPVEASASPGSTSPPVPAAPDAA
ncbi:MAG: adenosyl-hopene transferase HpnH [Planctomycetota bacterium]|nr:MAG: adenosyl-hopene transferase HpnH [Planctomycetota bacterium]